MNAPTATTTRGLPGPATPRRWGDTAASTTVRMLEWAVAPSGPAPMGSLRRVGELLSAPAVGQRLRALVRATSARVGAGCPPLGDTSTVGAGAVLLAASVGGRLRPELAAKLAAALPPPRLDDTTDGGWADALGRHAVVAAALSTHERDPHEHNLAGAWLDASPLTAALLVPGPSGRATALRTAVALAGRPHGPAVLTRCLADCHPDAAVLQWRGDLLTRLAAGHPAQVLDVYLAARGWHAAAWDVRTAAAIARLAAAARSGTPDPEALSVVHYWAGLAVTPVADIVARRRLPVDLRGWLALVRRHPAAGVSDL